MHPPRLETSQHGFRAIVDSFKQLMECEVHQGISLYYSHARLAKAMKNLMDTGIIVKNVLEPLQIAYDELKDAGEKS